MNIRKNVLSLLLCSLVMVACKKENPKEMPGNSIVTPMSGHYVWNFEIPGVGNQESHLVFYTDSIGYVMAGPAYSTNYMMNALRYTETGEERRWIGLGKGGSISKDGVHFVLFFKDITDSTVTIYKRECKEGQNEAENFAYPQPDATSDHGWNVYHKK